jgi:hypothetical protein
MKTAVPGTRATEKIPEIFWPHAGLFDMHISDLDLERYHLGMVTGAELDSLEEHVLGCAECATRAEEAADYVDATRAGIILGNFDR